MALAQLGLFLDRWVGIYPILTVFVAYILYSLNLTHPFGTTKKTFVHAKNTIDLVTKDGKKVNFVDLCKEVIPPCKLNPLLFNGHMQTVWVGQCGDPPDSEIYYKRWLFQNDDKAYTGDFAVDFVTKPYQGSDSTLPPRTSYYSQQEYDSLPSQDTRPMLVTLHGLSGGSYESYLRNAIAGLVHDVGDWEVCVVNSRGCANHRLTTAMLYNARATWDLKCFMKWVKRTYPNRPLFALAFSLGANIVANYIGEEGNDCVFKAACLLSNPWNLEASSKGLQAQLIGNDIYLRTLGGNMKALMIDHKDQITKNPKIDLAAVLKLTYLYDFDRLVQGPTYGYPTANAYYRDASSADSVLAFRIPVLAITAYDDPIAIPAAVPWEEFEQTPFGVICATNGGGHLGWFEVGGGRWFKRVTTAFFQKMARDIDLDQIPTMATAEYEGYIDRGEKSPLRPSFSPMRRKLHMPTE